jgi:acyl-CoA synthetase (AMP-forming)/AMP-acid ligase II/NAD(P)-dependent dehydrogenase (short-subunit alcohol dehydrogenase family)/acyl carrier protein
MHGDDMAPGAAAPDLDAIGAMARAVPGVRDAVAITDTRLRADGAAQRPPPRPAAAVRGTPIPGDRPAISAGPEPPARDGAVVTLAEALRRAAVLAPDRGTTYIRPDGTTDRQTYGELLRDARRALSGLRRRGVRPGGSVLLQCADSRSFVTAFWACILGGYLPTPVGPAADYAAENAVTRKLRAAWELLAHPLILTDDGLRERVSGLGTLWGGQADVTVASVADLMQALPAQPAVTSPDAPALNLLTSGSSGTPKCVQHAHRSVIERTYAAIDANGFTGHEVSLNWMPLDHVGGIVMSNIRDVILLCEHVNGPTDAVIRRPLTLLDWIDRFHVTNTWAPNFAFALMNRYPDEIAAGRWDLSSMRHFCNGGELVVARTAHEFLRLLAPHGLRPDAMATCWGMSETSSAVTYAHLDARDPSAGTVSLDPGSMGGQLVTLPYGAPRSVTLTEAGPPVAGTTLRIVDDSGRVLPEGRIGRLHVKGTAVMREYFGNPAANDASFCGDGWFDTGDLAFLRGGRLTLTGRHKDMVIVNGLNYPASEVEAVVEQVPGVRPACAAVCSDRDDGAGTDTVVVFFVPADDPGGSLDQTVAGIRRSLARDTGILPRAVIAVTEAEFPRTASGKIQRSRLAQAYRGGLFEDRWRDRGATTAGPADDWLMERAWIPAGPAAPPAGGSVLLYAPGSGSLRSQLELLLKCPVAEIRPGARLRVAGPDRVEIDPFDAGQHERALAVLRPRLASPVHAIYAWESTAADPGPGLTGLDAAPARLLTSLAPLARALPGAELTVLTRGALGVCGADSVHPGRAAMTAMTRTASAEGMFSSARVVDLPADADDAAAARIARTGYDADLVAVRAGAALTPKYRTVRRPAELGIPPAFLGPGGTVLLTGGLGGLGRAVAEHLLVSMSARLLIAGRTPGPALRGDERAAVLSGLGQLGEVAYAVADVADPAALETAVARAEDGWGRPLDLIVHCAGTAPGWDNLAARELRRETTASLRSMLAPKLAGGAAIERLLAGRPATSVVVYSSVIGFLGGRAFGAYAAANAAADGFAHRWQGDERAVRCLGWSMWSGPGMNAGSPLVGAAQQRGMRVIEPSCGMSLLLAALNLPQPHLLIGLDPANAYVQAHLTPDQLEGGGTLVAVAAVDAAEQETVARDVAAALAAAGAAARVVCVPQIPRNAAGQADPARILAHRESRPSRYAEPDGATESAIARFLGEAFERQLVGRDDSFFALGGDSVRAIQLMGLVNEKFGRDFPVSLLYEHPTVRELAAAVEAVAGVSDVSGT